jgi:hypothetical protein
MLNQARNPEMMPEMRGAIENVELQFINARNAPNAAD